eukprot:g64021.t1
MNRERYHAASPAFDWSKVAGLNLFVLQLMTFARSFIPPDDIGDRVSYLITLMLTATALKLSLAESTPKVSRLTPDGWAFITLGLHSITMILVCVVARFLDTTNVDAMTNVGAIQKWEDFVKRFLDMTDVNAIQKWEDFDKRAFSGLGAAYGIVTIIFLFRCRWYYLDGRDAVLGSQRRKRGCRWHLKLFRRSKWLSGDCYCCCRRQARPDANSCCDRVCKWLDGRVCKCLDGIPEGVLRLFCCLPLSWWNRWICCASGDRDSDTDYNEDRIPWHLDGAFYRNVKEPPASTMNYHPDPKEFIKNWTVHNWCKDAKRLEKYKENKKKSLQ